MEPFPQLAVGRRALVTGASSGIGLAVAELLTRAGATVAMLDVDRDRLDAAVEKVGGRAIGVPADVRSRSEVEGAVARATAELGDIDTLAICAGVIDVSALPDISEDEWDRTLDVNLKGAFLCCQAVAPSLRQGGRGRIVMISSDAGKRGVPLLAAYSASKFGLIGFAESIAAELAPDVTVNCICPVGVPSTGMGRQLLAWKSGHTGRSVEEVQTGTAGDLPMGRNASVDDIAGAVLFLVSDLASFITGVALDVDGGSSLNKLPGAGPPQC